MAVKMRVYWTIVAYIIFSIQINANLIHVSPNKKPQLIEITKVDEGYLPVPTSDDILQSVQLKNENQDPKLIEKLEDDVEADFQDIDQKNEDYVTSDADYNYDLGENPLNAIKAADLQKDDETTIKPSTDPTVKTDPPVSPTPSTTTETSTTGTVSTDPPLTTSLPQICDKMLIRDTELLFPTKDLPFDQEHKITWCFEMKDGPAVDVYLDYLNLDPISDYILIKSGHVEEDEKEKGKIITGTHTNMTFKIIHTNKAFIRFSFAKKADAENYGFKLRVTSHGDFPESTTPPATTVPSFIGRMQTITKSLTISGEYQNDTEIWDQTLRNALVESINLWRNAHNYTEYLEEAKRKNVIFERIIPCPSSWPDHANCVRIEFGVPLNETDYDGDLDKNLDPKYEISEKNLEEMWQEFAVTKLAEHGMTEYFLPNSTIVLLTWISVSVAIIIVFCIVLYVIWKCDLFKGYKRMDEEPEVNKTSQDDKKQNDISMLPTPFLFGEDEFPAEFNSGFDNDMESINDQDTTIYDVRTPPPIKPSVRASVKFASDVESINDDTPGAYNNPFSLEIEGSESYYGQQRYKDSEL